MEEGQTIRFRLKRFFANYPLTFYFGLLLIGVGLLILWLHTTFDWQFNFQQFMVWVDRRAYVIAVVVIILLGLVLMGSAVAYRQTANLNRQDYYLWLNQRGTRTLFPFFTPLHDWLRLRIAIYRWWTNQPYASPIHYVILVLALAVSFSFVHGVLAGAGTGGSGDACSPTPPDITISTNTEWSSNACYNSIIVQSNATLTVDGGVTITANSLTLGIYEFGNGYIVTNGDTLNDLGVTFVVNGNVDIAAGSSITGNGTGFTGGTSGSTAGNGLGGGGSNTTNGGGGGHGGTGGTIAGGTGGTTYDSSTAPVDLGSGGGLATGGGGPAYNDRSIQFSLIKKAFASTQYPGGNGGGAFELESTGTVQVDGTVAMNGTGGLGSGGGGSGGSVWLQGVTCSGSGTISANGADGGTNGAGGGGGRVYEVCTTYTGPTPTATAGANAGDAGTPAADGTVVQSGVAAALQVTGLSSAAAGTAQSVTVTAVDGGDSTDTSYTGTVHFSSTDSQAILPTNYTFVSGDSGTHTFTSGVTLKTAGSQTVTATDTGSGSVTGSQSVAVSAGSPAAVALANLPSSITAGSPLSITLTARDQYSNPATTYTGTIHFTSTDSQAVLPNDYTFMSDDNGTHTFTNGVTLKTAGSQSITATDTVSSSLTNTQSTTVDAASATLLTVTDLTDPLTAGAASSVTVTAKDSFDNIATGYTGTVHFSSTDSQATLPANYTFVGGDNGGHTFTDGVLLKTAGSQTVTATDTGSGSVTGNQSVTINFGSAANIAITGLAASVTAGSATSGTASVQDSFGNTITDYTGTVHFTATDSQATLPADYTFVGGDNGRHVFTNGLTFKTAGNQTLAISAAGITGNQAVQVTPADLAQFQVGFSQPSGSLTTKAGTSFSPVITAMDSYGNTVTGFTGSITFSSTDSQATVPANYSFNTNNQGTKTFTNGWTPKIVGSQTLTVTDAGVNPAITGTSAPVIVIAGTAARLTLSPPALTVVAGTPFGLTVSVQDAYGNPAIYTGTVGLSATDPSATLPQNYSFVAGDAGRYTFTNSLTLRRAGNQQVTIQDIQNHTLSVIAKVAVSPSAIAHYYLTSANTTQTVNIGWQENLVAQDAYSNTVTSNTAPVVTPSSTGHAEFYTDNHYSTGALSYRLSSGIGSLYVNDPTSEMLTLSVQDANGISGQSPTINVLTAGAATTSGGSSGSPGDNCSAVNLFSLGTAEPGCQTSVITSVANFLNKQPAITHSSALISQIIPAVALLGFSPVGAVLASAVTTGAAQGTSIFYFLFAGLTPFQGRRKTKWGTVRHAVTGLPIPGVFVLLLSQGGQQLKRTLTDETGRYGFLISQPGSYQLKIDNPLYGTYLSSVINVSDPRKPLVVNDISLLPIESRLSQRLARALSWVQLLHFLAWLYWPLLLLGSALAALLLFQTVTIARLLVALVYLLFWLAKLLTMRLERPYGIVIDAVTKKPQPFAVIQLTAANNTGKTLVHSVISDEHGRFLFTVRPDTYNIIVTKEGYKPTETQLTGDRLNVRLALQPLVGPMDELSSQWASSSTRQ